MRFRADLAALSASNEVPARVAAEAVGLSTATLARYRKRGEGPACRQVHQRLWAYGVKELRQWAKGVGLQFNVEALAA